MKKKKLFASLTAFCLSACAMVVGIYAASSASISINANVSYTALGNVKASLELSHELTPADKLNFKSGTGEITASKTVNNSELTGAENVTNGNALTPAKIDINGSETDVSGSFALGNIEIEAAPGFVDTVSYAYTLKITNNYTEAEIADNKGLKILFTQPTALNLAVTYQSGFTWTDIKNGELTVGKSVILAAEAVVTIVVTFNTNAGVSGAADLASTIVLEAVSDAGESTPSVFTEVHAFEVPFAKSAGADKQAATADDETYPYYIKMGKYSGTSIPWIVAGATISEAESYTEDYGTTAGSTTVMCTNLNESSGLFTYNSVEKQILINGMPASKLFLISQYCLNMTAFDTEASTSMFFNSTLNAYMNGTYLTDGSLSAFMTEMSLTTDMVNYVATTNIPQTKVFNSSMGTTNDNAKFFILGWDGTAHYNVGDSFGVCRYFGSDVFSRDPYKIATSITATASAQEWWLRSGSYYGRNTAIAIERGGNFRAYDAHDVLVAVRPAFVLNLTATG